MLSGHVAVDYRPDPILSAADTYAGSIVDLGRSLVVDASALAHGRENLAAKLRARGLAAGDRVVLAVANGPQFFATLTAILSAGGAPLLVHFQTPPAELKRTALRFGARAIVTDTWSENELGAAAVAVNDVSCAEWLDLLWADVDRTDPAFQNDYPALPAVPLHPTSGTTGEPKVAVRPGACAMAEAIHYVETIGIDRDDVLLAIPPMSHAYAYGMCVMVPLLCGAHVVTLPRFRPKLVHQALREQRITILPAVPIMLDNLLFGAGESLYDPHRCVLAAGAPLAEATAKAFQKKAATVVRPLYGTTETGGICVAPSSDTPLAGTCVGPPMNGVQVRAPSATDAGAAMGRVAVRSCSMMAGYLGHGRVDTTRLEDGWFETGDLGSIDAQGYVHLRGRETDVINVYGMKVVPSEVQDVITALPAVREAHVYGGKYRSGAQFVKAAIVPNHPTNVRTIQDHCKKHLVYYKVPTRIILVDALPRSPSGKILRNQLP